MTKASFPVVPVLRAPEFVTMSSVNGLDRLDESPTRQNVPVPMLCFSATVKSRDQNSAMKSERISVELLERVG